MKKFKSNSNVASLVPVATGLLSGAMFLYFLSLFLLIMTYQKKTKNIAGVDYVSEVTRWPGHTKVINIPVYYG